MELVRVNREDTGVVKVAREELQDKSHRFYFQETIQLQKGKYYISPIDLNREQGQIVVPYEPNYRIGIPVFDENFNERSILVANLSLEALFRQITALSTFEDIYLTNQDGDFLLHPDETKTFGFELGFEHRFDDEFPNLACSLLD